MKACAFHRPRRVAWERVSDPEIEEPGDVVVRVELAAVCGSDLHVYRGHETGLDAGTLLGHEFLGEIVEAGAAVAERAVGERVVSPFTTSCGDCFYCRIGLTSRCARGELFGWVEEGRGLHGAQAEYVRVPLADSTLVPLPEEIDPEAALLAGDVLATGFFCAESGGVGPGSVVAVLGCGPVGLMAVIGARELGAEAVYAIDSLPERLELAAAYGAEPVELESRAAAGSGGGPAAAVEVLREATDGRGADVVLEAVGSPEATRSAVDLVRPGGTISAVGVHTEERFAFSPVEAYDKNLTYRAGRCPARHYMDRMLALAATGRHDLSRIVSHRLPLAETPRAYDLFDRRLDGCTKVVLQP